MHSRRLMIQDNEQSDSQGEFFNGIDPLPPFEETPSLRPLSKCNGYPFFDVGRHCARARERRAPNSDSLWPRSKNRVCRSSKCLHPYRLRRAVPALGVGGENETGRVLGFKSLVVAEGHAESRSA
jgi:hypothetical protein